MNLFQHNQKETDPKLMSLQRLYQSLTGSNLIKKGFNNGFFDDNSF